MVSKETYTLLLLITARRGSIPHRGSLNDKRHVDPFSNYNQKFVEEQFEIFKKSIIIESNTNNETIHSQRHRR
jgi:hypothetical protein